jgi:signal transduction histidine kinase
VTAMTDFSDVLASDRTRRVPEPGTDDEIGRLAETMNAMLTRLEDSAARQRRFVADASHELRSPLTAIRTGLEVGLAHPDQAPWPAIAERAVKQAARLEDLISELLLLARSDAGRTAARRRHVPLAPLLGEIQAGAVLSRPGIVELDVAPGIAVTGNAADLSRLFRNIVDNAVRYARSTVLLTARTAGDAVCVQIADDGPGIPAEERERVFDRFVRLDASRAHPDNSTGLGLAIAKEIATAHRGTIVIEQAVGGGALVTVTLPAGIDSTAK